LVEAGADINAASDSGVTPLMNAAGTGNKEAVEFLIQKGADVNHRTSGNYTPLMQAALVGQLEIVKILLDAGADPTVKDTGGRTAIAYAEDQKHDDIVQLIEQKMPSRSRGKK
jgi:ankyrin repeat protein